MNSNLIIRVVSALSLLPVVLWLLMQGGYYTIGLLMIVAFISFYEYAEITQRHDIPTRALLIILGLVVTFLGMVTDDYLALLLLVNLSSIFMAFYFTFRVGEMSTVWTRLSSFYYGIVYIGFACVCLTRLRTFAGAEALTDGSQVQWVYLALLTTWGNDTTAYFAGRAFGKHKMYEKLSPKKTWEGFFGGAIGTIFFTAFGSWVVFKPWMSNVTWTDILWIGIPCAVISPVGDLFESMFKRSYDVKDSGAILPGHGGILDRVDALFFVGPWVLFYAQYLAPLVGGK